MLFMLLAHYGVRKLCAPQPLQSASSHSGSFDQNSARLAAANCYDLMSRRSAAIVAKAIKTIIPINTKALRRLLLLLMLVMLCRPWCTAVNSSSNFGGCQQWSMLIKCNRFGMDRRKCSPSAETKTIEPSWKPVGILSYPNCCWVSRVKHEWMCVRLYTLHKILLSKMKLRWWDLGSDIEQVNKSTKVNLFFNCTTMSCWVNK